MMAKIWPILLASSLALLLTGATADHRLLLQQLCHLDASAPEVARLSDVGALIYLLKTDGSVQCPLGIAEAILQLEPVIGLQSVCSMEAADVIVDYWARYVDEKSPLSQNLPWSLRSLFIGYALQASKLCKITMMAELQRAVQVMGITEQDVHLVTKSIGDSKQVKHLFGDEPRIEDLLIVVRTDAARDDEPRSKINMPPKEKELFELMRDRCLNKFKPVYDALMLPIIRLASIGMNYKDRALDRSVKLFRRQRVYRDWFNVIVACEAIVRHEAIMIPARKLNAFGDTALITVLEAEDLAELREKTGLTLEEPALGQSAPIDYRVQVRMYNQVIDVNDFQLIESIERYGHGLEETTKLRLRMIKRLPSIMKLAFKSKTVQFGLRPFGELQQKRSAKFGGLSSKVKNRLNVIGLGLFMMTGVALSTAILIAVALPLAKIWLAVGGCIIFLILVGMILGVLAVKE